MNDELCLLSATELRRLIARREVSPIDIVDAVLTRAERLQPELNCFVTLCGDSARQEARLAQEQITAGKGDLGLLHGIPFTVKDLVDTRGVRTTFGALPFKDNIPAHDAVSVARLRASGAILIGKTTTPEFGSKALTDSPLFGRTRNAWNAKRTSGGSSGGAAAALAAGIAPLAVATDGGGSTRIPAACNGVVGLKQSAGVIPHSQALDAFGNQTYVTPMTRTVADTVLMMQVMGGEDPVDPLSIGLKNQDYAGVDRGGGLRGCKINFCEAPRGCVLSSDVQAAFRKGLALLAELGAELIEMSDEGFDVEPIWRAINHTVWRARFEALIREKGSMLSETFRRQIASAENVTGVEYQQAMFNRTALFRRVQTLLVGAEIIATPTIMRTALPIDQDLFDPIEIDGRRLDGLRTNWFPWTMPYNLTGHPAITMPCGFGSDGLPIGIQFVGRFRQDADLLQIARQFETTQDLKIAPMTKT